MKFVVVMATHQVGVLVTRALASVSQSLAGFDWALVLADDASTDDTVSHALCTPVTASYRVTASYDKAPNLAAAKNRAVALLDQVPSDYDLVLFMDDDDEMLPGRVTLAQRMVEEGQEVAFGDLKVSTCGRGGTVANGGVRLWHRRFSPCASVIRRRWVTHNFWQPCHGLEDSYTFQLLRRQHDLAFCYHPVAVHHYHRRPGSYSFGRNLKRCTERLILASKVTPGFTVAPGPGAELTQASLSLWGHPAGPTVLPAGTAVLTELDTQQLVTHPGRQLTGWNGELEVAGGLWWRGWPVDWLPATPELGPALRGQLDQLSVNQRHIAALVQLLDQQVLSTTA